MATVLPTPSVWRVSAPWGPSALPGEPGLPCPRCAFQSGLSPGLVTTMLFSCLFFFLFPQQQLDIPIPKYFLKEKVEVIREREKILAQILAGSGTGLPVVVCISL